MKANRYLPFASSKRLSAIPFSEVCLKSCRKLLSQIDAIKHALISKYRPELNGQETVLHSALNEAEALAWQTPYPHLFFPVLAEEKAQEARRWAFRQERIRERVNWTQAFAA